MMALLLIIILGIIAYAIGDIYWNIYLGIAIVGVSYYVLDVLIKYIKYFVARHRQKKILRQNRRLLKQMEGISKEINAISKEIQESVKQIRREEQQNDT